MSLFPAIVRVIAVFSLTSGLAAQAQDAFHNVGAQADAPPTASQQATLREFVNRGNVFLSRHQYEQALGEYEQAIKLDPKNTIVKFNMTELYNNWGSYLFRQRQYDGAEEKLKKCLKLNPTHRMAKANLELLRHTLDSQGIVMSMDLDTDAAHPPEPKKPAEKKPEESGKIIGSSQTASPVPVAPPGRPTLFGAGGMPESSTFVSGSATYPTYSTRPTATSAPMSGTINPNPTRTDLPSSTPPNSTMPPASTVVETRPAVTSVPQSSPPNSVDEKLADLEKRFEGCTHTDWPLLKRLEQLEIKVNGQAASGKITDRIEALQKL